MSFGLTNAPPVFQALVNNVLQDFLNCFVFVYLDDILIFSPDLTIHKQHVLQVLQHLLQNHIYVKAEKCDFHTSSISFFGFIVGEGAISMDPEKDRSVCDSPESRKQLQCFLGFANFHLRFIKNFSTITTPLKPSLTCNLVLVGAM